MCARETERERERERERGRWGERNKASGIAVFVCFELAAFGFPIRHEQR